MIHVYMYTYLFIYLFINKSTYSFSISSGVYRQLIYPTKVCVNVGSVFHVYCHNYCMYIYIYIYVCVCMRVYLYHGSSSAETVTEE